MVRAMVAFAAADLGPVDTYKLLTGLVVPRPIGWIGTVDADGRPNLAPYSFFNAVCAEPPTILFSAGRGPSGEKDSLVNARATGTFTWNLVDRSTAEAMNQSSAPLDHGHSEFDFAGLTPTPSVDIPAPGVAEARAVFECRVVQTVDLGGPPAANVVVFGEVVRFHVDDEILDGTRVDFDALDAVGRLAGSAYATTRDRFTLDRPG
jgi:flavin reductase (DIM6/NTAB) family NADH-FMN oxidoreductase RutF